VSHFVDALKKYVDFGGRASRTQFWMFVLVYFVLAVVAAILDYALGTVPDGASTGLIGLVLALALFLPSLALTVRRIHDTGRSGWWVLILLVPCIGFIAWLVFALQASEEGANQWGPNPRH